MSLPFPFKAIRTSLMEALRRLYLVCDSTMKGLGWLTEDELLKLFMDNLQCKNSKPQERLLYTLVALKEMIKRQEARKTHFPCKILLQRHGRQHFAPILMILASKESSYFLSQERDDFGLIGVLV